MGGQRMVKALSQNNPPGWKNAHNNFFSLVTNFIQDIFYFVSLLRNFLKENLHQGILQIWCKSSFHKAVSLSA
jgi:hypothetical protein